MKKLLFFYLISLLSLDSYAMKKGNLEIDEIPIKNTSDIETNALLEQFKDKLETIDPSINFNPKKLLTNYELASYPGTYLTLTPFSFFRIAERQARTNSYFNVNVYFQILNEFINNVSNINQLKNTLKYFLILKNNPRFKEEIWKPILAEKKSQLVDAITNRLKELNLLKKLSLSDATQIDSELLTEVLLQNGLLNSNQRFDFQNETPLHRAAYDNATNVIKVLLSHGADPYALDESKKTPLNVARYMGSRKTEYLLKKAMEKNTNKN